ncbi:hypothetical protein MES4922_360151 [Mesorhizobium ventifaucium]|uniref:HTH hxlR-type domain-containing protein n=1 Tax=Mesorhizobium ventifaucium TaxID=666020 RepID=A0ABN8K4S2_9HYPH|nr:hypothetical protein MES4922_360151 [Mesorhizobium ventifaucium]
MDCAWIGCARANPERAAIVVNMRMIILSVLRLLEEDHLVTRQPLCRIMVPGPSWRWPSVGWKGSRRRSATAR